MVRLRQAIVVEGRYDKNTLAQLVDAPIFVTNGFGIFKDAQTVALLRDGAGLVIRNRLKSVIPPQYLLHAYIPDVYGKEKRKAQPGKEGKLGVEGMDPETLLSALRKAGATFLDEEFQTQVHAGSIAPPRTSDARPESPDDSLITKTDLFELGLTGRPDSREKRNALKKELGLPEHLSANALLTALNCITTRQALYMKLNEK